MLSPPRLLFALFFLILVRGRFDGENRLQVGLRQAVDVLKRPARKILGQAYFCKRPFLFRREDVLW